MPQVIIDGTLEQIAAQFKDEATPLVRRRSSINQQRYRHITEQRKLVRRAFDIIRRKPERSDDVNRLAGALGGRYPLDRFAIELAGRIIAEAGTSTIMECE